jgi:hypothetical protein
MRAFLKFPALMISLSAVIYLFAGSCKKAEITNPYTNVTDAVENDNPDIDDLPEGSFAWLHAKIFRPTCANSGCHDGTFEPEFRSIGSTYSSLVNHPTISNTPDYAFHYRVRPGMADSSFLIKRMTSFVPNTSGVMPPSYSVGDDWNNNEVYYINKIKEWINAGARDIYGQPAPAANVDAPPLVYGLVVFPHNNTTTPYSREENPPYGIGSIEVPSELVDVWIFPYDDNASPDQFESITLLASTSSNNFTGAISSTFGLSGPVYADLFDSGSPAPFVYKATLDLSAATPGTYYYLRNYLDDGSQPTLTEIPNDASSPVWYLVFSLKVTS